MKQNNFVSETKEKSKFAESRHKTDLVKSRDGYEFVELRNIFYKRKYIKRSLQVLVVKTGVWKVTACPAEVIAK